MDAERALTEKIIGAAMEVHDYWGSGLIESIYEKSLAHELGRQGIEVKRQVRLDLKYKDLVLLRQQFRMAERRLFAASVSCSLVFSVSL